MAAYPTDGGVISFEPEVTLGQKLGAIVLIVNAVLVFAEQVFFSDLLPKSSLQTSYVVPFMDVAVAVAILAGQKKAVGFAVARLALGALLFGFMQWSENGAFGVVLQLAFSGGVLLLLVGEAGVARLSAGGVLVALCLVVGVLGVYSLKTGYHPLGFLLGAARADIESDPLAELRDDAAGWRMDWPGDAWRPRKAEAIEKDNPLVTQWAVQPAYDAHLLVVAEALPPGTGNVTTDDLQKVVESNLRAASTSVEVLEVEPLGGGRYLMHLRASVNGMPLEYFIGLVVGDAKAIQVHGFAHEKNFPRVSDEIRRTIESLTLL